jgi:hypothetical protein
MASSLTAVRWIADRAGRAEVCPTPPRRAVPGDRPRSVHRPSDRGGLAAATGAELERRFGPRVVRLVESVSDDPSVTDYDSRKRELRHRVALAGPDTRAVFAADKIAKVRELALLPTQRLREPTVRAKVRHYRASLEMLHRAAGELGLVDLLDAELERVLARTVNANSQAGARRGSLHPLVDA